MIDIDEKTNGSGSEASAGSGRQSKKSKKKNKKRKQAKDVYRGRADTPELKKKIKARKQIHRVGLPSKDVSNFKDRSTRSKEGYLRKNFYEYAAMQTLERDNCSDAEVDSLASSEDEELKARVVPSLVIFDPFENHDAVGGAPKKSAPAKLKEVPQLFIGISGLEAETRFKKVMEQAVALNWTSTDAMQIVFVSDEREAAMIRNDNKNRARLLEGTVAAGLSHHSPNTKRAAIASANTPLQPKHTNLFSGR